MANKTRGEIEFTAGGTTHKLRLGNAALRAIESHFDDEGLDSIIRRIDESGSITAITVVVQKLLGEDHYTLEDVDAIIDEVGYDKLGELIGTALEAAMPEATKNSGKKRVNRRRSTGRR